MKDLGRTKYCFELQIEYLSNEILIHQLTNAKKILKQFYIDKAYILSSLQ